MNRLGVKSNRPFPKTETLICEFESEGKTRAYKVTIDANVYQYAWTKSEVIGIATGQSRVSVYRPEGNKKSIDANVIIRCDTIGNLYTIINKLHSEEGQDYV